METVTLRVTGMTCGGCENAVKRALGRLEGVTAVEASHAQQSVSVTFDPGKATLDAIKERIGAAGYRVVA
jgi:copper ion binding protein